MKTLKNYSLFHNWNAYDPCKTSLMDEIYIFI